MTKPIIDRLVVALGLALDEIHHPGAAASGGFDIDKLCRAVIKEATGMHGIPEMIQEESRRRELSH